MQELWPKEFKSYDQKSFFIIIIFSTIAPPLEFLDLSCGEHFCPSLKSLGLIV